MGISPATAKNQFIEAMVKDGASLQACNMWFGLMTSAATSADQLEYVWRLCDLGKHIDSHPVHIITTCLSMGKFTKVDDALMKCVWQMVSDDTDSQQETDEFWKDADGEIEITGVKHGGDDDDDDDSGSYETTSQEACRHDIVGECHECMHSERPALVKSSFSRLKRRLVLDDEAEEVGVSA